MDLVIGAFLHDGEHLVELVVLAQRADHLVVPLSETRLQEMAVLLSSESLHEDKVL